MPRRLKVPDAAADGQIQSCQSTEYLPVSTPLQSCPEGDVEVETGVASLSI